MWLAGVQKPEDEQKDKEEEQEEEQEEMKWDVMIYGKENFYRSSFHKTSSPKVHK